MSDAPKAAESAEKDAFHDLRKSFADEARSRTYFGGDATLYMTDDAIRERLSTAKKHSAAIEGKAGPVPFVFAPELIASQAIPKEYWMEFYNQIKAIMKEKRLTRIPYMYWKDEWKSAFIFDAEHMPSEMVAIYELAYSLMADDNLSLLDQVKLEDRLQPIIMRMKLYLIRPKEAVEKYIKTVEESAAKAMAAGRSAIVHRPEKMTAEELKQMNAMVVKAMSGLDDGTCTIDEAGVVKGL